MGYVLEVILVTAFGFSIVTCIAGLFFIISPDKIHALAARLDVTVSTEKYFDVLDNTKFVDRYIYRYHYFFGLFIVSGASYTLFMLIPYQGNYSKLPTLFNPVVSSWLYDSLVITLLLTCSFVLLFGLIIFFRPSALKTFEEKMNSWKDTSKYVKPLDKERYVEQQKPLKNPRLFGFIVLLGSLYVLWQTAPLVFK